MRKEEKAQMGQTIRTETSPDRSSHQVDNNEALMGRKMRGGPTDLSHSLGSTKATNTQLSGAVSRGKSPL